METENKWEKFNSFADLPLEKQAELLKAGEDMKQDPENIDKVLIFLEPTNEWIAVEKKTLWAEKWGIKTPQKQEEPNV